MSCRDVSPLVVAFADQQTARCADFLDQMVDAYRADVAFRGAGDPLSVVALGQSIRDFADLDAAADALALAMSDQYAYLDDLISRTSDWLADCNRRGISTDDARAALVGSFIAGAEQFACAAGAVQYALCLLRLVAWQQRIHELEEQLGMHQAVIRMISDLEEL